MPETNYLQKVEKTQVTPNIETNIHAKIAKEIKDNNSKKALNVTKI